MEVDNIGTDSNARLVYFDNNASTPPISDSIRDQSDSATAYFANSSAIHSLAGKTRELLEESRSVLLGEFPAKDFELIFTPSGSLANYFAVLGSLAAEGKSFQQLVVSGFEHSSIHGFTEIGAGLPVIECRSQQSGVPDLDDLRRIVAKARSLVCVMHVNHELGTIFPVVSISKIVRDHGGILLVDGVQSFGKFLLAPCVDAIDILTFSAHKFHGPKGLGGIIKRRSVKLAQIMPGGVQEGGIISGTVNVPGAVAAKRAIEYSRSHYWPHGGDPMLRDRLENFVSSRYPEAVVIGKTVPRSPLMTYICLPGLLQEDLVANFSKYGVCVGTGSACASRTLTGSSILARLGIPFPIARGGLRISLSCMNTLADAVRFEEVFDAVVDHARLASPFF